MSIHYTRNNQRVFIQTVRHLGEIPKNSYLSTFKCLYSPLVLQILNFLQKSILKSVMQKKFSLIHKATKYLFLTNFQQKFKRWKQDYNESISSIGFFALTNA